MSNGPVRAIGRGLDAAITSQAQFLDSWAKAVQSPLASQIRQTGPGGQLIKDVLHGVWLGHPLHPALTDVPIGAWTAGLLFDLLVLDESADAAYVLGVLGPSRPPCLARRTGSRSRTNRAASGLYMPFSILVRSG